MPQSDEVKIAVLQNQMDTISKQVTDGFKDLNTKVDNLAIAITAQNTLADKRYVAKEVFEAELADLKNKISHSWIQTALGVVFGVIMTGLVSAIVYLATRH